MIFPSNRVRILVATTPVDFRKGHDGLTAIVQSTLREEPFTGTVFVFRAKQVDRLKLLYWDGTGLVMAYKRLEETSFTWPAVKNGVMALNHAQFEAPWTGAKSKLWKPARRLRRRSSGGGNRQRWGTGSGIFRPMSSPANQLDLTALPPEIRAAFAAQAR